MVFVFIYTRIHIVIQTHFVLDKYLNSAHSGLESGRDDLEKSGEVAAGSDSAHSAFLLHGAACS